MKNRFLLLFSFLLFFNILFAQGSFSYKRQLIIKQCDRCDCINYRKYKMISKLSGYKSQCAEADCIQDERYWWIFSDAECQNYCSHDFSTIYGDEERIEIDNCLTDGQKLKQDEKKLKQDELKKNDQDYRNNKIKDLLSSGKYYQDKEELRNALYYYNQVLSIDKNNYEASSSKSYIDNFFYNRTAGYQYRKLFESNYKYFVEKLKIALEDEISKTENGQVTFSINISFDTNGVNKSTISQTNIQDLDSRISSIVNSWLSSKPIMKGYYVKADDLISVDVSWKTGNSIYTINSKGSSSVNAIGNTADHYKFINSLKYSYGKFYFTSKYKKLVFNGWEDKFEATDILFTKYKFSGGPFNALYSLLLPGLGKYKVTNGTYGQEEMIIYGASWLLQSIIKGFEYQSKKEYYESTNPGMQEDNYTSANLSRQSWLVLFFSTLGLVVYDTTTSFIIGIENIRHAKKNKQLYKNNSPYVVQTKKFNELK